MIDSATEGKCRAVVIHDEHRVREFVADVLRSEGWNVAQSVSAGDALERLHEAQWSVVFCDLTLGSANSYNVLRTFKEKLPETKVVLMSGHASAAGTLNAAAFGAYDYLLKPFGAEELRSLSHVLREQLSTQPQKTSPARRTAAYPSNIELVGRSQAFIEVMKQVGRLSNTNLPVLLTGESGTGMAGQHSQTGKRSRAGGGDVRRNDSRKGSAAASAAIFRGKDLKCRRQMVAHCFLITKSGCRYRRSKAGTSGECWSTRVGTSKRPREYSASIEKHSIA